MVGLNIWVFLSSNLLVDCLGFYDTSTFVGYLMPNANKQFYFKQFN